MKTKKCRQWLFLLGSTSLYLALGSPSSRASTLSVDAMADIFGAGQSTAPSFPSGGGILPPSVSFNPGANLVLTFSSVTGSVSWDGTTFVGADGAPGTTNINSAIGISGIKVGRFFPLVGVFLDNTAPVNPAPLVLDFTGNTGFATLSPTLRQSFFIGDGLTGTGTGSVQQFIVPTGATRLFLGFEDGQGFSGNPSFYGDNVGTLSATFSISPTAVPEPTSLTLMTAASVVLATARLVRRRVSL